MSKEYKMTPKRFIRSKLSGKITVEEFLAQNMNFLKQYSFLSDILEAYKNKEIFPHPAFIACQAALWTHFVQGELNHAKESIEAIDEANKNAPKDKDGNIIKVPTGSYLITLMVKIYDRDNQVIGIEIGEFEEIIEKEIDGKIEKIKQKIPTIWSADSYGSAERKADRELFKREDSVYAVIENTSGVVIKTNVMRDDSIARLFKHKKGAICKVSKKTTDKLKFGVKVKNDRSIGPWSMLK